VLNLTKDTLYEIMHNILFQFPITAIKVNVPKWMRSLGCDNKIIAG
jgi:hypothetical protein